MPLSFPHYFSSPSLTIQETATLEAEAYELEQKTAIAAEAKAVLDSWVRYEGQVKQRQQKELAENVIAKVKKELESPKSLQQILQQAVADVESTFLLFYGCPHTLPAANENRDRCQQGIETQPRQHSTGPTDKPNNRSTRIKKKTDVHGEDEKRRTAKEKKAFPFVLRSCVP